MLCQDGPVDPRRRPARRSDALSRARIVTAAIDLLDDGGIDALTFRALATSLSTGPGAIYHHVANKTQLLSAATSDLLTAAIGGSTGDRADGAGVHLLMARVHDAIADHPWAGAHLAAAPWQPAALQLLDRIGAELTALEVPAAHQFDAASVLVFHVLGVAAQRGAVTGLADPPDGRAVFIADSAADATAPPHEGQSFLRRIGPQLAHHDDRDQFLAGVRIIMAGIDAVSGSSAEPAAPAGPLTRRQR